MLQWINKDFRAHQGAEWGLEFSPHSHTGLPNSAFSAFSLLSRSEKAPEWGYLLLLHEARLNLFSLTVSISCWKLLYPSLGAKSDVILSIVDEILVFTASAAPVVIIYISQQQLPILCHSAVACHTSPWDVWKEVLWLVLKFQRVFLIKKIQGYSSIKSNKVHLNHLCSKILAGEIKRWSHSGGGEGIVNVSSLVCVATKFENYRDTNFHILGYIWCIVLGL